MHRSAGRCHPTSIKPADAGLHGPCNTRSMSGGDACIAVLISFERSRAQSVDCQCSAQVPSGRTGNAGRLFLSDLPLVKPSPSKTGRVGKREQDLHRHRDTTASRVRSVNCQQAGSCQGTQTAAGMPALPPQPPSCMAQAAGYVCESRSMRRVDSLPGCGRSPASSRLRDKPCREASTWEKGALAALAGCRPSTLSWSPTCAPQPVCLGLGFRV